MTLSSLSSRVGLSVIQRNIRKWIGMRTWTWWKLYTRVKPLLSIARQEDEMKMAVEELAKVKEAMERMEKLKKELEEQNVGLLQAKNDLFLELQAEQDSLSDAEERISQLVNYKAETSSLMKEMEERLAEEESGSEHLAEQKKKMEEAVSNLKKDLEDVNLTLQKAEQDKQTKDNQIKVRIDLSDGTVFQTKIHKIVHQTKMAFGLLRIHQMNVNFR